jgi:hypothetical protein
MPLPFPVMNPYLDAPAIWSDYHTNAAIAKTGGEQPWFQIQPAIYRRFMSFLPTS